MAEVRPFLQSVLEGVKIPPSRFDEVLHHYEVFDGKSEYNSVTAKQRSALESWFADQNLALNVEMGFRHAAPSMADAFKDLKDKHTEKVIAVVLSSFRCFASFEKYVKKLKEAQNAVGASSIAVEYMPDFYKEPLFIAAQSDKVRTAIGKFSDDELEKTFFLFSAHSIPLTMSEESGYADQFREASSLVAKNLGIVSWDCGYQSRSGNPNDPWLIPDVKQVIRSLDRKKFLNVMLIPIGFLCDNVEVLYDLDVEAKQSAEQAGLRYCRASTVADHPKFIEMLGRQVVDLLGSSIKSAKQIQGSV